MQTTNPSSTMREALEKCPFCGSTTYIDLGKKGSCQLHGEPFQSIIIHCKKHECPAKPKVEGGDIYNGGKEKAIKEVSIKWNTRTAAKAEGGWMPIESVQFFDGDIYDVSYVFAERRFRAVSVVYSSQFGGFPQIHTRAKITHVMREPQPPHSQAMKEKL